MDAAVDAAGDMFIGISHTHGVEKRNQVRRRRLISWTECAVYRAQWTLREASEDGVRTCRARVLICSRV
jgi:hypothetical protein